MIILSLIQIVRTMFLDPPYIPTPQPTSIPYSQAVEIVNKSSDTLIALSNIGPVAVLVSLSLAVLILATGWVLRIILIDRRKTLQALQPQTESANPITMELVKTTANLVRYNEAQDERARVITNSFQTLIKEMNERHIESLTAFTAAFHASDDRVANLQKVTDERLSKIEETLKVVTSIEGSPALQQISGKLSELLNLAPPLKSYLENEPAFRERILNSLNEAVATMREKKRKTDELKPAAPPSLPAVTPTSGSP